MLPLVCWLDDDDCMLPPCPLCICGFSWGCAGGGRARRGVKQLKQPAFGASSVGIVGALPGTACACHGLGKTGKEEGQEHVMSIACVHPNSNKKDSALCMPGSGNNFRCHLVSPLSARSAVSVTYYCDMTVAPGLG